jgi:hypothetical protein
MNPRELLRLANIAPIATRPIRADQSRLNRQARSATAWNVRPTNVIVAM